MRLGEISFCNHIGFNIKSDELKKRVLDEIDATFKQKIIQKHHEKFQESSLRILNTNPYMMSLRSNGNPYFLYLTRYNNVNQCIFIDKKIQQGYFYPRMVIVKLWFDDALFQNTLLDGEMIKDNNGDWVFLVQDIIGDCGGDMMNVNIVRRINRCLEIFDKQYVADSMTVCQFQVKRFFHFQEFDYMVNEFMPALPYSCRGIYFNPLFLKFKDVLYNFDDTLVKNVIHTKYKQSATYISEAPTGIEESSASSTSGSVSDDGTGGNKKEEQAQLQPRECAMFMQKSNQPDIFEVFNVAGKRQGVAFVNSIKASKLLREAFMHKSPVDRLLFKCAYNAKFSKWCPLELIPS